MTSGVYYNWTEAVDTTGWSSRYWHTTVVYENKICTIGGVSKTQVFYGDVWCTNDDMTLVEVTSSALFGPRRGHTSVVMNNKMFVLGGTDVSSKNDVWSTGDGGETWNLIAASAGWNGRSEHASVVFDNKIYIFGGIKPGGVRDNEIWYSENEDVDWVEMASPAWGYRSEHSSVVYDGQMYIIGGFEGPYYLSDVWSSGFHGLHKHSLLLGMGEKVTPVWCMITKYMSLVEKVLLVI